MSEEDQTVQEAAFTEPQDENTQVTEANTQETEGDPALRRPSEDEQERNFKRLREKADRAERRNTELERQNSDYMNMVKEFVSGNKSEKEPELDDDDSDIPTLGQTKKTARREAETVSEKVIRKVLEEERQKNAPSLLKNKFSDFDDVVSTENVNYLIENEPELAESLKNTPDFYKKGVAAYKMIKGLGIAKKDSVNAMKQDSAKNTAKPVSPNAIAGRNSVGDANVFSRGLTSSLKKQLQQEMSAAIKGR